MTLDCTKKSQTKLKRYKLAKLSEPHDSEKIPRLINHPPIGVMSILNIQDDPQVDLEDIVNFLENDVILDACLESNSNK